MKRNYRNTRIAYRVWMQAWPRVYTNALDEPQVLKL
jgi:hypothetical protein